jgi:UDPglucose--hexose-1-phosphate uridylyltransferase
MPELRKDPIIDRWVIIATERGRRPSDFAPDPLPSPSGFSPFAPGNEDNTPPELFQIGRDAAEPADTTGWRVRVVPNKFPALSPSGDLNSQAVGMFDLMNGVGAHEVVIEHPKANWDIADATTTEMSEILEAYIVRNRALAQNPEFRYILTFRNYGTAAGASINHPHSQIIALPVVPKQVRDQLEVAREHFKVKRRSIFGDLVRQELASGERIVEDSEHFVVLCPYASRFPFEMSIYPKRQQDDFTQMTPDEIAALSEVLPRTLGRIKKSLGAPAYNMMMQTSPITSPRDSDPTHWTTIAQDFCWHIDILPRLTQVAGFEWGTGFYINPVSPESATKFLQEA